MQVGVAKYVNSVSKPGMTTGMHTGRHTDRHVWTPYYSEASHKEFNILSDALTARKSSMTRDVSEINDVVQCSYIVMDKVRLLSSRQLC